jgi:hypothetical protein|eukprot:COSAG01_NODE_1832_length_9109_cov_67.250721_3_plen_81_part_00
MLLILMARHDSCTLACQLPLPAVLPRQEVRLDAMVQCATAGPVQLEVGGQYDTPTYQKTIKTQEILVSMRLLICSCAATC